jgi:hypothetical protein
MTDKVLFRDYKNYPTELMDAADFRDMNNDHGDGAFFALAEEQHLFNALIALAEFETDHTYTKAEAKNNG